MLLFDDEGINNFEKSAIISLIVLNLDLLKKRILIFVVNKKSAIKLYSVKVNSIETGNVFPDIK